MISCALRVYPTALYRKVTAWARVQVFLGLKVVGAVPPVIWGSWQ